jgi:hypothetical protein
LSGVVRQTSLHSYDLSKLRGQTERPTINLKLPPFCSLAREQKRLGKRSFSTKLERPKILVPGTFRNIGLGFNPEAKLVEIVETDFAIPHGRVAIICGEYTLRWGTLAVKRCGCAPSRAFREGSGRPPTPNPVSGFPAGDVGTRRTASSCGDRKSKSPPVANARHASRTASKESHPLVASLLSSLTF